ncbi:MAG: glycosyltransferase family 2 protein [Clostridia bacterium]|nr:glycosyltransferase family 2 protein [Clostridia bacterium]
MKKISIMVPCYNEEENVVPMSEALVSELTKLEKYDYEIVFIDNCSLDSTREKLRDICLKNNKIKAIFNSKNFGQFNSPYYGLCQTTGDCTISVCCDFQDPVEMIPKFIEEWEKGYKIVCAVKTSSKESKIMYALRSIYYKTIRKLSKVEQIEHFTGFGLYDKSFIEVLRNLGDPTPFIRGIVAELGPKIKKIEYEQAKRRAGKTSNNFASLYDAAMLSFTSYTKFGVRAASFLGMGMCGGSVLGAIACLILKIINPDYFFTTGTAAIILTTVFVGGLVLFFLGFLGEYIMSMNARIMNRPLVIEEERINFDEK